MRWALVILFLFVTTILAVFAAGAMLPLKHVASRKMNLNQPPDAVWQAINNHRDEPQWRPDLNSVERIPDRNGHPTWQETYKRGMKLTLEDTESLPPKRLVRLVADQKNMFSGRWEFEIMPSDAGSSLVKITEFGEVPNPLFRFVSRFLIGHAKSIDQYLTALAAKFGDKPEFVK